MMLEKKEGKIIVNPQTAEKYLNKLVLQAGEILRGYFKSRSFTSKSKGSVDFLTQADGRPWNVFEKDIIASNGIIHDQLLELLR